MRRAFRQKETIDRGKGLIQKYVDGFLDLEKLKMDIIACDPDQLETMKQAIQDEVLHRIRPGMDNRALWDILEIVYGPRTAGLMENLADIENKLDGERLVYEKNMEAALRKKGISGSALIPNIESDPDWMAFQMEKEREFKERLGKIREQGFLIDKEEAIEGITGISAPIRNYTGKVVGAIGVGFISSSEDAEGLIELKKDVYETAKRISQELGSPQR